VCLLPKWNRSPAGVNSTADTGYCESAPPNVIRYPHLKQTRGGGSDSAPAVDEVFADTPDLRDMEMGRDKVPIRKHEM